MPTYEYSCKKCGKTFDFFQPITAEALKVCPPELCSKKGSVERQLGSGGGVLFKGSGFYATDYRSKSYQEAQQKDKPAPAPEGCPNKACACE
jgi:putative FmdB family regulatory protein